MKNKDISIREPVLKSKDPTFFYFDAPPALVIHIVLSTYERLPEEDTREGSD